MLIAGPNLTIDRTSTIPELRAGDVLRLADVVVTPGGKGLNVARAALALGVRATLVAFVPGHTGRASAALIAEEGVALQAIDVARRDPLDLGDPRARRARDRAQRAGAGRSPRGDWERLEEVIADRLPHHGVLVCSGSLPPGAPPDGYGRLVAIAHAAGVPVVVDANGATLGGALEAGPDVVTPNLAEAEGLLHGHGDESVEASPDARPRALQAARGAARARRPLGRRHRRRGGRRGRDARGQRLGRRPQRDRRATRSGPATCWPARSPPRSSAASRWSPRCAPGVTAAAAAVESPTAGVLDPARMRELLAATAIEPG